MNDERSLSAELAPNGLVWWTRANVGTEAEPELRVTSRRVIRIPIRHQWTVVELACLVADDRPQDSDLALRFGCTTAAIQRARRRHRMREREKIAKVGAVEYERRKSKEKEHGKVPNGSR